ncbi:MAG: TIGR00266 family protein [Oscillospiraceae bacterium]|jgi:uncharacterized protein (TIGR00266 family)|nr:TIGR00266 family protein [Oscillospiraceae bacterium]
MQYQITGDSLPVVTCTLEAGESMVCEGGAMSWMSPNMDMQTSSRGGLGKALGRMVTGESVFQNIYTAVGGAGMIAFAAKFPGSIKMLQISSGNEMIVQKSGFLASTPGIELSLSFQKKIAGGLFGGEGFIMQRLSGEGVAFVEIDGSLTEYELAAGQSILVSLGCIAAMSGSCTMDITRVKGAKNVFLGGEGLFNTVVTGPGKVLLQSIPISGLASVIAKYIPTSR